LKGWKKNNPVGILRMEIIITEAKTTADLEQILILQEKNHRSILSLNENMENGFLTVKHDLADLENMNAIAPQIIAKVADKVVAFALVMLPSFKERVPLLVPMFTLFNNIMFKGKAIAEYEYYVMGQICVEEEYRSKGIFDKLYAKHKEIYSNKYEICVTEISSSNFRSMKAHSRVGFKKIHTFDDESDEWDIVVWDWK
jgi:L-amino acid N-acyltransferase YncA